MERAAATNFLWRIEHEDPTGAIEEIGEVTELSVVKSPATPELQCFARAIVGSSVIFGVLDGEPDIFDPDFTFGRFRVTHSAGNWSQTCPFVEVTTCPNVLSADVTPVLASHTTRDVSGCEQGTANVPLGPEPLEDNVAFP